MEIVTKNEFSPKMLNRISNAIVKNEASLREITKDYKPSCKISSSWSVEKDGFADFVVIETNASCKGFAPTYRVCLSEQKTVKESYCGLVLPRNPNTEFDPAGWDEEEKTFSKAEKNLKKTIEKIKSNGEWKLS